MRASHRVAQCDCAIALDGSNVTPPEARKRQTAVKGQLRINAALGAPAGDAISDDGSSPRGGVYYGRWPTARLSSAKAVL